MKIVLVCPTSSNKPYNGNSLKEFGLGASWSGIINLARELSKLGHEVIVANNSSQTGVFDGVNYPCQRIPEDMKKDTFKNLVQNTDILIINRAGNMEWQDCLEQFCNVKPRKKVLWCHDSGGADVGRPIEFAKFDRIVSVSEWLNEINKAANPDMDEYFMDIPLGVDINLFTFNSAPVDRYAVCFLGNVSGTRRPHYALYAFRELIKMYPQFPWTFHIIGSAAIWGGPPEGTDATFRQVWEAAKRDIPKEKLYDHGDISSYEVAKILPRMGMMVYPTYTETCGVGILECQAAGVPIIVPDDSMQTGVKERIYHTETGVVRDFKNIQEVAMAMYDLATNDHAYNKIRNQAREKTVRYNDWSYIAQRWEQEVLKAKSAREIIADNDSIKNMEIGIGILSYRDRPLLEKCITTLKAYANMPIRIVVWDNASIKYESDNVQWLKDNHPDIHVMESPENVGCTKSRNAMVKYIQEKYPQIKYILLSDMDVIYRPNYLYPMVQLMEKHSDAFIVGYAQAICGFRPEETGKVSEIMSISSLYRIEMLQKLGYFNEEFFYYSFDSEIAQRGNINQYHTYVVLGKKGYEHVGGHANKLVPEVERIKKEDVQKWQKIADGYSLQKRWEDKNASDYVVIGNQLKEKNEIPKAMMSYLEGISRFPDNDTLFYCLGNLYKDAKQFTQAIEAYKKCLEINPRNFKAKYAIDECV